MPKTTYTKEGGQIVYDASDWLASVDFAGGSENDGIVGNSMARTAQADPFRFMGYISPGKQPTDVATVSVVSEYIRNGVMNSQDCFMVSNGSKLQKLDDPVTTPTIINDGTWPHAIDHSHANEVGDDCVSYYCKIGGTNAIRWFYSFHDDTDWDVGINTDFATGFNDDFMSTVPASPLSSPYLTGGKDYPHPLIVADDDVMYIGDRNFVHAYDGQVGNNGTFYPAVLTLPYGFIITAFAKTSDRKLAIAGYYSSGSFATQEPIKYAGKSLVWIWNLLDLDPDFSYDLHDNYVSEIVNWNGRLAAFTAGAGTLGNNGTSKLQVLEGGEFTPVFQWSNGLPIRGGVDSSQNELYWNAFGTLNTFVKNPYTGRYIYNYLTNGSGSSSGFLKVLTGVDNSSQAPIFYMSSGATTSGGLQYFSGNYTSGTTLVYPKTAYPSFPPLKRGRLKKATINFKSATADGISLKLDTYMDKTTTVATLAYTNDVTNLKQVILDTDTSGDPLGDFTSIQPRLTWAKQIGDLNTAAPVVESVIYDFENINI